MRISLAESIKRIKKNRTRRNRMVSLLLVLSLIVSMDVFWILRQPGVTLAGDADCGIVEHIHDAECLNGETPCELTEHTHTVDCYSDKKADDESLLEWQDMFKNYPYTGNLRDDLVGIAQMQVGYTESASNFQISNDGVKNGYTRYGDWYGAPYSDWSAMFVSFCLNFAGADEQCEVAVSKLIQHTCYVHAKDGFKKSGMAYNPGRGWKLSRGGYYRRATIFGHGDVPTFQILKALKAWGYDGWVSIEFEGMEDNLMALEIGLENLKRMIKDMEQ